MVLIDILNYPNLDALFSFSQLFGILHQIFFDAIPIYSIFRAIKSQKRSSQKNKMDYQSKVIAHLSQDTKMAEIIASSNFQIHFRPVERSVLAPLLESIVSQQLSVKAADTIHRRFLQLFDTPLLAPHAILGIDDAALRAVGLSGQKVKYIKNVASFALENSLEISDMEKLSDEEIIQLLTQIKGVGQWTVEMILMFTLQRPDVFPIDDLGIYQSIIEAYQLDIQDKKEMRKAIFAIAEKWRPYRTWACRYLWKWRDTKKKA